VDLNIPVGQGGIDQHIGDTSHPFDFGLRDHERSLSVSLHRTRRLSAITSGETRWKGEKPFSEECLLTLEPIITGDFAG
jgi:hypothetical protein